MLLKNSSKALKKMGTKRQRGALRETKRVLSEMLAEETPLKEVDYNWFEMRRAWVQTVSSEILESTFCDHGEIEEMLSALRRVSYAIYKAQSALEGEK